MSKHMSSFTKPRANKGDLPGRDKVLDVDMPVSTINATRTLSGTRALSPNRTTNLGRSTAGTRSVNLGFSTRSPTNLGASSAGTFANATSAPRPLADADVANRFPENPTANNKLRLVFDELDINGNKTIEIDEFRRVLKALNIGFTIETVDDLYQRMDVEKKGAVAFPGFLDWAEHYPILIDAIYYRSRELIERTRRDAQIDATREGLEANQRAERLAMQQYDVARDALEAQLRMYETASEEHQNRILAEKDCAAELFDIAREVERMKTDRNSKDLDFQSAKEHERAAFKPVKEVQYQITQVETIVVNFEDAVAQSQDKERQLEAMLEEAKRETAKFTSQMQDANDELGELKSSEKEAVAAHEEVEREVSIMQAALSAAESELAKMGNKKSHAEKRQQDAQQAIKRALSVQEEEERKLAPLREREGHHKALHSAAVKKVDDADEELREKEMDLNNYLAFRSQAEADEYGMYEQEARLREQRYNLDDRDGVHYDETTRLINAHGHTDTRNKTRA